MGIESGISRNLSLKSGVKSLGRDPKDLRSREYI